MNNERMERVMESMKEKGLGQILVTDSSSIFYLTGIRAHSGERLFALYLCTGQEPKIFANKLFTIPENCGIEVLWHTDSDDVASIIADNVHRGETLGVDRELSARFLIPLQDRLAGTKFCIASECIDWVRAVKTERERELMRMNSEINDRVMLSALSCIKEGVTEKEVADFITDKYIEEGCDGPSFKLIVAFGPNAADPHHETDNTPLRDGDCVILDIGGRKDGYCSDMTRTYFYGSADPEYTAIHDLVRRANEKAESIIKPGVRLCDIDAAARDMIAEAGYGENFTHRLGHFIGMETHEYGDVSSAFDTPVKDGMCFSIEPGVYLTGKFGVRIEDLVIVTSDGCEILNSVDKHWSVL